MPEWHGARWRQDLSGLSRRMSGDVSFLRLSRPLVIPRCEFTRGLGLPGVRARLEWRFSCRVFVPRPWPSTSVGAHPSCGHRGQMHLPPAACMARRESTIAEVGDQYRKGRWQCIAKLSGTPLPFREGIVTKECHTDFPL